ncbi:MAG: SIS domain-containing protein [Rhodobacteraceae bacterium]|nr:SIS domain-containing protein [Paracoccaceae bacterium]
MASEIAEIPEMLARQVDQIEIYYDVGRQLKKDGTCGFITCARGTSDHAATFFKYLMETRTGLPVASLGPSIASVYETPLRVQNFTCMTFSQSGGSPDLVAFQNAAKAGGARTIAVLNVTENPVGAGAGTVLPLHAGPERAVAATKSFVGMLFASLAIYSGFRDDRELRRAFASLPDLASAALMSSWTRAALPLANSHSLYCIGRGPGLAIAAEAALKLKETCRIHAEAYSAAEVRHGPIAIADSQLGALIFGARGRANHSINDAAKRLKSKGASVFLVDEDKRRDILPVPVAAHDLFSPLLQAVAFYSFVERLACDLGYDPDAPVGLDKVTRTM